MTQPEPGSVPNDSQLGDIGRLYAKMDDREQEAITRAIRRLRLEREQDERDQAAQTTTAPDPVNPGDGEHLFQTG